MIDKKDPRQGSVKTDSADDDVIIDLTDEVVIKTEEDDDILELTDDMTEDLSVTDDKVKVSDVDEDLTAWEASSQTDIEEEDMILELDDQFADDENDLGDDELIASAINESLGPEENETYKQDDDFGLKASDDDVIILENERDMVDESLAETTDDDAADSDPDTDVFDLEEDIELEYEMDEDEDELIALEDERTDEQPDFVSMVLGETVKSGRRDQSEEPTEYIEFDAHQQNDMMDKNENGDERPPVSEAIDAEASENIDIEDLPDLTTVKELDFEDDDETNDVIGMIQEETDSSDDIIARTVGQSLNADAESETHKSAPQTEFDSEGDDDVIALDVARPEDQEIVALENGESLEFEEADSLFIDTGSVTDLEDDDEIIPLEISDEVDAGKEDDIVEITEFDQHYPTDRNTMLEQAGILHASDAEEGDFLELIEVEDDRQTGDEEFLGIGESDEMSTYAQVDNFFNEASEEEKLELEATGPALNNGSTDGSVTAAEEAEDTEDASAQELAGETAAPDSDEEAFDFNFDPGAIAQQVDRLDAFLSDEPEVASLPEDDAARGNDIQENLPHGLDSEELSPLTSEQIDTAIERVINEKFSGRIESIIYEVIEKAVAKEIDRLKGVLLDSTRSDDI